jgi:hypothetical protein
MDLEELIRSELSAQADQAPDPHAVLSGARARARGRRHRRMVATASAAVVAALVAVGVPYAVLHGNRPGTAAAATPGRQPTALDWQPAPPPDGMREIQRVVGPGVVGGTYGTRRDDSTLEPTVIWQVGPADLTLPAAKNREPVRVGAWDGFFDTSTPESGQTLLWVRVESARWALILVERAATSHPRELALRVAASLHHGDGVLDAPVRFGPLPGGLSVSPWLTVGGTGTPGATKAEMVLTGPGSGVNVTVQHGRTSDRAYPGDGDFGGEARRRPVQVGDRTGYWVQYTSTGIGPPALGVPVPRSTGAIALEVPLPSGDTLQVAAQADPVPPLSSGRLKPTVSDADLIAVAAAAVQLPVDYGWIER